MIDLTCSKCQTKLPVAEEKIGKTLFVCPQCSFPLEAPSLPGGHLDVTAPHIPELPRHDITNEATLPPDVPIPKPPLITRQALPGVKITRKPSAKTEDPDSLPLPTPTPPTPTKKSGGPRLLLLGGAFAAAGVLVVCVLVASGVFRPRAKAPVVEETKLDLLEVMALSQDLKDEDPEKRAAAALALAKAGPSARDAWPALLEALSDKDDKVRFLVLDALEKVGPPAKEDFPNLSAALRDDDPDMRAYAVSVVDSLGALSWDEINEVRSLTEDEDPHVKAAAEQTLQRMEKDMLQSATEKLKDPDAKVRSAAAETIGELGPAARSATSSLIEALADSNPAVRLAAAEALSEVGAETVPLLKETLAGRNADARRTAIAALAKLGPDAGDAIPAVIGLVEDPIVGVDATNALVKKFGVFAVPDLVTAVVAAPVLARRNVLLAVIEGIGPNGVPAIEFIIKRNVRAREIFVPVIAGWKKNGLMKPTVVVLAPLSDTGKLIYKDLRAQFIAWDLAKKGLLGPAELKVAFPGRPGEAAAFLRRLDRNGDGLISLAEYEHWAHHQAEHLAAERDARENLAKAQQELKKKVAAETALSKAASRKLHEIKNENEPKKDKKLELEAAEAKLRNLKHKAAIQNAKAQAEVLKRQRQLAKLERKNAPGTKLVTPKKWKPPVHQPVAHKPVTRPPIVQAARPVNKPAGKRR